jgi:hypothetical protein
LERARGGGSRGAAISRLGTETVADSGDIGSWHLDEGRSITVSMIKSDAKFPSVSGNAILRGEPPLTEVFLVGNDLLEGVYIVLITSAACLCLCSPNE